MSNQMRYCFLASPFLRSRTLERKGLYRRTNKVFYNFIRHHPWNSRCPLSWSIIRSPHFLHQLQFIPWRRHEQCYTLIGNNKKNSCDRKLLWPKTRISGFRNRRLLELASGQNQESSLLSRTGSARWCRRFNNFFNFEQHLSIPRCLECLACPWQRIPKNNGARTRTLPAAVHRYSEALFQTSFFIHSMIQATDCTSCAIYGVVVMPSSSPTSSLTFSIRELGYPDLPSASTRHCSLPDPLRSSRYNPNGCNSRSVHFPSWSETKISPKIHFKPPKPACSGRWIRQGPSTFILWCLCVAFYTLLVPVSYRIALEPAGNHAISAMLIASVVLVAHGIH